MSSGTIVHHLNKMHLEQLKIWKVLFSKPDQKKYNYSSQKIANIHSKSQQNNITFQREKLFTQTKNIPFRVCIIPMTLLQFVVENPMTKKVHNFF